MRTLLKMLFVLPLFFSPPALFADTDFGIQTPAEAKHDLEQSARIPGPGETNETASAVRHRCHIDYYKTLRGVLRKDPKALMDLFRCSACAGDGASGEGYGEDIQAALDYCGDMVFANAFKNAPRDWRQRVGEELVWNRDIKTLRRKYPKTFGLVPHPERLR